MLKRKFLRITTSHERDMQNQPKHILGEEIFQELVENTSVTPTGNAKES
jgi:hypothetical protein